MTDSFKGLEVVNLIGVFYRDGEHRLMVADEFEGALDVVKALERVLGEEVRLLAHHRPREPHDKERWGGGCCVLENTGECPFGHHVNPQSLYMFNEVGVLCVEGPRFFLDTEDEGRKECSVDLLTGHRSQIVVTSIPNLDEIEEKVRSFDPSNIEEPTIENLTERITEIRNFLIELDDLKNKIDE